MKTIKRTEKFNFEDLFIFEMANNHQGDVEHGRRIIKEIAEIAKEAYPARGAIKLQFRDLDTFIHPDFRESETPKHIPRFLGTRLSKEAFAELIAEIEARSMITIATPFDEPSVDLIQELNVDIIKIGSCSALDKPLLERVSEADKPVICSTGGLTIGDTDWIVTFFKKRSVHFALMHCVAEYPVSPEHAYLNHIATLRARYPDITIGFSTHESPQDNSLIQMAYALGARIFEKHVGISTDTISLNKYSAEPDQVRLWIQGWQKARKACGRKWRPVSEKESSDLQSLMRGVYAARQIVKGEIIERKDVFFAMPLQHNQLFSGLWKKNEEILIAHRDYAPNEALSVALYSPHTKRKVVFDSINTVIGMLNEAKIAVGHDFFVELSHHYGVEKFNEVGCIIITCFNREEYAKKIIVQLPGQWNPEHYHKKKDETFHVLSGKLKIWIENREFVRHAGEIIWIPRGTGHEFGTEAGVIFEEISTKDYPGDSYYKDKNIAKQNRNDRKTHLENWGRYQFD